MLVQNSPRGKKSLVSLISLSSRAVQSSALDTWTTHTINTTTLCNINDTFAKWVIITKSDSYKAIFELKLAPKLKKNAAMYNGEKSETLRCIMLWLYCWLVIVVLHPPQG